MKTWAIGIRDILREKAQRTNQAWTVLPRTICFLELLNICICTVSMNTYINLKKYINPASVGSCLLEHTYSMPLPLRISLPLSPFISCFSW